MVVQFVAPKTILFSAFPIIDVYFNYVIKKRILFIYICIRHYGDAIILQAYQKQTG